MVTFFTADDYREYLALMATWCERYEVGIWCYCLMPNHVHLIATPPAEESLALAIGEAHRRYTRHINFQRNWRGHLWQGRFSSFPMDEQYLLAAARYIELNPVRAGLVERAEDYPWSSCPVHLGKREDPLVKNKPLLDILPSAEWQALLNANPKKSNHDTFRKHERTGRPLGSEKFIEHLEMLTNRPLKKRKPGPRPKRSQLQDVPEGQGSADRYLRKNA
jgi:putative transposase